MRITEIYISEVNIPGGKMLEHKETRKSLQDAVKNMLTSHYVSQHDEFFALIQQSITDELAHIPLDQEDAAMTELAWWIDHYLTVRANTKNTCIPDYVRKIGASSKKDLFITAIKDWQAQRKAVKNVLNKMAIPKDKTFRKELVRHFNREVGVIPAELLQETIDGILPYMGIPVPMEEEHIKWLITEAVSQWGVGKEAQAE